MYFGSIYPLSNFDHDNIIIDKSTMLDHGLFMVYSDSLELSMVNHDDNIIIDKSTMLDHGLFMVYSDSLELSMVNHGMYHGQLIHGQTRSVLKK